MARFNRRFEVKNEMYDAGKIRPDEKNNNGKLTPEQLENIRKEIEEENKRPFFEGGYDVELDDIDEEICQTNKNTKRNKVKEEFDIANRRVEDELLQYYNDSIELSYVEAYLKDRVSKIYGHELERLQVASASEMVESFLENNSFNGVNSYKKLTNAIESVISIMRDNEEKEQKRMMKEKIPQSTIEEKEGKQEEKTSKMPSQQEVQGMLNGYINTSMQGELAANAYIASQAKKIGVDKAVLKKAILEAGKQKIPSKEKVLHYHRTSIENASKIIDAGYLLNRDNIKRRGGDISQLYGSSSSNVQFSVDKYDKNGMLQFSGYDKNDNLGASSNDVVFVMGPKLFEEETYNCFGKYPTVEKADIKKYCTAILAKNQEILIEIQKFLEARNIRIPTILQKEFSRDVILQLDQNNEEKEEKQSEKNFLQSAVEATLTRRTGTINEQISIIVQLQKSLTMQHDNTKSQR